MMKNHAPTSDSWRALYELANRVKELAPWSWMDESHIFGVQDPQNGESYFVSVMGLLGEHMAVGVYLGIETLYDFLDVHDNPPNEDDMFSAAERILSMRQLQLSFVDREELDEPDLKLIKELGLKFRGRGVWPLFRTYEAGYAPWHLNAEEVRILTLALEQVLDIAPRFRSDKRLLRPKKKAHFFMRVPRREGDMTVWEDEIRHIPPPIVQEIPVKRNEKLIRQFNTLPKRPMSIEVDVFLMLTGVGGRGERPQYPYLMLLVDTSSGMVIGQEMLSLETTRLALWGEVPMTFLQQLVRLGLAPNTMLVSSPILFQVLQPLLKEAGIQLKLKSHLPTMEMVRESLLGFLRR